MKPTALIDGDIVAYQVAAMSEVSSTFDGTGEPTFDPTEVREGLKKTLEKWTAAADCGDYLILLTGPLNFRKLVTPTYKSGRVDKRKPVALGFAKDTLRTEFGAMESPWLEADDLIGLMLTGSMAEGRGVAVSIDKDLRTVPGLHCNPLKGGVRNVTEDYANKFWMTQVLTGDPVDGYGGVPGVGPAKAAKALAGRTSLHSLWVGVQTVYAARKMTVQDALATARLARILRTGDYDKDTKEVLLWHPTSPSRLTLPPASQPSPPNSDPASSEGESTSPPTS